MLDGDEITYTRTNTASSARETLDVPAAILADKVGTSNPNQGVWLINDNGTFVKSSPHWSNSTFTTTSTPICDLTCLDILSMRQTPLSLATGTVRFPNNTYGPCFAVQGLDEDSAYYVPMRLRLIGSDALYEGEWFKYQYDSTTASTASDDSIPIPTASAEFVRGPRRQRLTLGSLQQALTESQNRLSGEIQVAINRQADNNTDAESRLTALEATENILAGQIVEISNHKNALSSDEFEGTVVKFGNDPITLRSGYVYSSTGWVQCDADLRNSSSNLFGIAVGTNSGTHGLLVSGLIYSTSFSFAAGRPLFISQTAGELSVSPPVGTGSYIRIVGFSLGSGYIYIQPQAHYVLQT